LFRLTEARLERANESAAGPRLREAAVLLPLYEREGQPQLLFIKRTDKVGLHKGEIGFPGGRLERDDPTPLAAALREAHEELGIPPETVTPLGALPIVATVVTSMVIHPFVGRLPAPPEILPDPYEVAETIEVPLAFLRDPANYYEEDWLLRGVQRRIFVYRYGLHDIWGATGRIVQHFLERLDRWPWGPFDRDWDLDDIAAALAGTAE
jgi:8-oxo-dGTP pyrophosphatase MutT (NUDIX family)